MQNSNTDDYFRSTELDKEVLIAPSFGAWSASDSSKGTMHTAMERLSNPLMDSIRYKLIWLAL